MRAGLFAFSVRGEFRRVFENPLGRRPGAGGSIKKAEEEPEEIRLAARSRTRYLSDAQCLSISSQRAYLSVATGPPPRYPGPQGMDEPVELPGRAFRGRPAVDHCEQLKVPLPARVVRGLRPCQQPTPKIDVIGAVQNVRVLSHGRHDDRICRSPWPLVAMGPTAHEPRELHCPALEFMLTAWPMGPRLRESPDQTLAGFEVFVATSRPTGWCSPRAGGTVSGARRRRTEETGVNPVRSRHCDRGVTPMTATALEFEGRKAGRSVDPAARRLTSSPPRQPGADFPERGTVASPCP